MRRGYGGVGAGAHSGRPSGAAAHRQQPGGRGHRAGGTADRVTRLKDKLLPLRHRFDFLFIDCPPSLELLTLNALNAADSVLVPIQCEFFALEGLSQLTNSIRQIKKLYNPELSIEGVLLTMYDGRLNLTVEVAQEIKRFFADKVYATVIPRNVRLSEAPSHGLPSGFTTSIRAGRRPTGPLRRNF